MKTTRYFEEQVLRKRPYIDRDWCRQVLAAPLRREVQPDGRVRSWVRSWRLGRLDRASGFFASDFEAAVFNGCVRLHPSR